MIRPQIKQTFNKLICTINKKIHNEESDMIKINEYQYNDIDELFSAFQQTLKPKSKDKPKFKDFTYADRDEYTVILKWLKENNYYIDLFPNVIQKQQSFQSFAYDEIRAYIRKQKQLDSKSSIKWSDRIELIESLNLLKKDDVVFQVEKSLDEIIKEISNGSFATQNRDEQLATLCNSIEYLLKNDKAKFNKINSAIFYDYFNNEDLQRFRKETQVFRHAAKGDIDKRRSWSDSKKQFYIRLGVNMITVLHNEMIKNNAT